MPNNRGNDRGAVRELSGPERELLEGAGWRDRVGSGRGLWVHAYRQQVRLVRFPRILRSYPCSTGRAGMGETTGSGCTPRGWHRISEEIGEDLPTGAVLQHRKWTGRVWDGGESEEDLILSRILRLEGIEEGVNRGEGIDTHARLIYIHGTHAEDRLGVPASHGCVRMSNDDIVEIFPLIGVGTLVLITEEPT